MVANGYRTGHLPGQYGSKMAVDARLNLLAPMLVMG